MNTRTFIALGLALTVATPAAFAQKDKKASIGNFPFWPAIKAKAGSNSGQYVPGLNAVLQLTDEQIHKIHEARQETLGSDELKSRATKVKDANVSAAERDAAKAAFDKAQAELTDRVDRILTAEQKALIAKIGATHAEARTALQDEFQNRFATVDKTDAEARKKIQEEFTTKLDAEFLNRINSYLTPAQRAAREKAAEEEKAAAANAVKIKKDK